MAAQDYKPHDFTVAGGPITFRVDALVVWELGKVVELSVVVHNCCLLCFSCLLEYVIFTFLDENLSFSHNWDGVELGERAQSILKYAYERRWLQCWLNAATVATHSHCFDLY